MKRLKCALCISLLLAAASGARAQKGDLPPGLGEASTVRDILEYLNRKGFPEARIGLQIRLPRGSEMWDPESMNYHYPYVRVVFSTGFKLASSPDDCHLWLKNDDVRLYNEDLKDADEIDMKEMTAAPPPYAAEFSVWLETASHDKGKGPYLHTTNPKKIQLLGAWRTEFRYRGVFTRSLFGIKIPALKPAFIGGEYDTARTVSFTFDDRMASEWFNTAFRRLIKLCQARSAKPE